MKKLLIITGLILSLWGINYPYAGGNNANNNYLTLAAKNFIRFGVGPTYFAGQTLPLQVPYYLHHPILIFLVTTIPFLIFGFHNWVVHVPQFLFILGDIFLIYTIGAFVWNKKIGFWAAAIASVFPVTTFFWKYMMFEQGSLFFNLLVVYFLLRYLKKPSVSDLIYIFLTTFLSGLTDWGVLYIFLPMLIFGKRVLKPFIVYCLAAFLSLGSYLLLVYNVQGGFGELSRAIGVHTLTPTLSSMKVLPFQLLGLTLLRLVQYFTPLALFWLFQKKSLLLWFFLLFGAENIFVLPNATWWLSYFVFYFLPFFAFSGAIWMNRHARWWLVVAIVVFSVFVNYHKIGQITAQIWQYDAALRINRVLKPYETVGVVNFSGDILEQYFFHPTQPMRESEVPDWQRGNIYPNISKIIVAGNLISKTE